MTYRQQVSGVIYTFDGLVELMAKATPAAIPHANRERDEAAAEMRIDNQTTVVQAAADITCDMIGLRSEYQSSGVPSQTPIAAIADGN